MAWATPSTSGPSTRISAWEAKYARKQTINRAPLALYNKLAKYIGILRQSCKE
jgi:hypothetical protein